MITIALWLLIMEVSIIVKIFAMYFGIPMYEQLSSVMNNMAIALAIFKSSIVVMGFVHETKRK